MERSILLELYHPAVQLCENHQGNQRCGLGLLLLGPRDLWLPLLTHHNWAPSLHELLPKESEILHGERCAAPPLYDPTYVLGLLFALL